MSFKLNTIRQLNNLKKYLPYIFTLVYFLINVWIFTEKGLQHDEPHAVWGASRSLPEMWNYFINSNYGVLFEFLLHFWIKLGGIELEWLRILPLIFASFTLLFTYKIANYFSGIWAGILTVILFSCSSCLHYYSFELRAYSLYTLFVAMSIWFCIQYFNSSSTKATIKNSFYWLWIFSNLCLIYTHWLSWFFVGCELMILFPLATKNKKIRFSIINHLLILTICFIPAAINIINLYWGAKDSGIITTTSIEAFYSTALHFTNKSIPMLFLYFWAIGWLGWKHIKYKNKLGIFILLSLFLPYFFIWAISFSIPMFFTRYVIYFNLSIILICSIFMIEWIKTQKKKLYRSIGLILFSLSVISYINEFKPNHKDYNYFFDYKNQVKYIKDNIKETPYMIVSAEWDAGFYYNFDNNHTIFKGALKHKAYNKYNNFYHCRLFELSDLDEIKNTPCNQIFLIGQNIKNTDYQPLVDSLKTYYSYYSEVKEFAPFLKVQIFSKKDNLK